MKIKTTLLISIIGIFVCTLIYLFFRETINVIIVFIEKYISEDGKVNKETADWYIVNPLWKMLKITSILCFIPIFYSFVEVVIEYAGRKDFIDIDAMSKFFFEDSFYQKKNLSVNIFYVSTASGIFFLFLSHSIGRFGGESVSEQITTILLLIASVLLILSALSLKKKEMPSSTRKEMTLFIVVLAIASLMLFGEEIS